MKYPTESALQNHFLQSVLPHPVPQQSHFLKTREFYQPQKFIWNNPHRSSSQMYKFYHYYNDKYSQQKEPQIKQLEEHDRQQAEMQRIYRLIDFRNKTRQVFGNKQRTREVLEAKTKKQSQPNLNDDHIKAKCYSENPQKRIKQLKNSHKSQRIMRMEETYHQSITKYDQKQQKIGQLIGAQTSAYHKQIRQQFHNRNQQNLIVSKLYKSTHKQATQN